MLLEVERLEHPEQNQQLNYLLKQLEHLPLLLSLLLSLLHLELLVQLDTSAAYAE